MLGRLKIYKIIGKDKLLQIYGWYQDICQKWQRTGKLDKNDKKIQPGYRNGIRHWKVCHDDIGNWEKRNNRRNRNAKSGKCQNAWVEENLQVLGNIRSGHP